jgi:hypothetical protein
MLYSPCPTWAGWYGSWAPPPCTFIRDGQDPLEVLITEATIQETVITEILANSKTGGDIVRKNGLSRIPNQTIRFPQRNQKLLGDSVNYGYTSQSLMLRVQGVVRTRKG